MIKSMTGYGGAKGETEGFRITIELKSVNNRYLDTAVRLPRGFIFVEDAVKTAVGRHISRGKVDVFITVDSSAAEDTEIRINEPLLQNYLKVFDFLAETYGMPNDAGVMSVCRLPDVLTVEKKEADRQSLEQGLLAILEEALAEFDAMRLREGGKLRDDVLVRIVELGRLTGIVEAEAPRTLTDYRVRLEQKMQEVLGGAGVDESRILAEAAIYADRVAVDEETVRLRSHLSQLEGMINGDSPAGRKIDFLIQELNREANTIGSKCQSSGIAYVVVDMKSEIEKIREQIQNVE